MRALALLVALATVARADRPPVGATAAIDRMVVVVDGLAIWQSEVDDVLATAKIDKPTADQLKAALDGLIDNALQARAGKLLGLTSTDAEVDAALVQIRQQSGLDDAGFDKALADVHYTRAAYRDEIRRQIVIQKLAQVELVPRIAPITETDVDRAYAERKAADPKVPALDKAMRDVLRSDLYSMRIVAEQERWLKERRAHAHVERRP